MSNIDFDLPETVVTPPARGLLEVNTTERRPGLTPRAYELPKEPAPATAFGRMQAYGQREPGYIEEAFRLESSIVNALDWANRPTFAEDPDYNPIDDDRIKGTKFEQQYLDSFVGVRSREEATSLMSQIDREEKSREIIARGGGGGILAAMAAGVLDPTVLLPVTGWWAGAIRGGRAARTATRTAEGAVAVGGAVAAQEAILQGAQETRTTFESMFSIGAGTLIGGVLGGAAGALSRADVEAIGRTASEGLPATRADEERLFDEAVKAGVGAEVTDAARGTGELKGALGVEQAVRFQDPLLRLQTSPIQAARTAVRDLAETPLTLAENVEGIATTIGGSVETQVKMAQAPLFESLVGMDKAFSRYFFGKDIRLPAVRSTLARIMGTTQGKLSYQRFKEAVYDAAIRGDKSPIPEVEQAAGSLRGLWDKFKNEAIEVGLFTEDIKPLDDISYVPRVYNTQVISARRTEFVDILSRHFAARQADMLAKVEDLEARAGVTEEMAAKAARDVEELSPGEIRAVAEEVTDVILGNSPQRMLLPADLVAGPRGPLKERVLRIPTTMIRDFVERDPEVLARRYTQTMAADIGLVRKFGSTTLDEQIRKINDDANAEIAKAKGEKAKARLQGQRTAAIRDLAAIRDRIRGTYGIPDNPDGLIVRTFRVVRNINYARLLGGMTLSAIPDLGRPVSVYGLNRVMRTAFHPFVRGLRTMKLAGKEAQLAGTALDMVLDTRAMAIADIMDDYGRGSKFERGLQGVARNFGVVSLMAPWNAAIKQFVGVVAQTKMLELVSKAKLKPQEAEFLAAGGIDAGMAQRIAKQFKEHGEKDGAVWWANTRDWTDKRATESFRAFMVREIDRTIITPGQDKPLWMSTELGKVIGQFRSFNIASMQRTLLSGLQQRDMASLNGMMMMLSLGALSYYLKSTTAGYPVSDDPVKWATEAFDRSGLTGWIMDVNNITEKMTRGRVGMSAITGEMASRYASRNVAGAVLGPTFDMGMDIASVTGSAAAALRPESDADVWKESDTHALRKMVPLQNVFYLRQLFDAMERGTNNAFGVKTTR